jgi:hypothetical protein
MPYKSRSKIPVANTIQIEHKLIYDAISRFVKFLNISVANLLITLKQGNIISSIYCVQENMKFQGKLTVSLTERCLRQDLPSSTHRRAI